MWFTAVSHNVRSFTTLNCAGEKHWHFQPVNQNHYLQLNFTFSAATEVATAYCINFNPDEVISPLQ